MNILHLVDEPYDSGIVHYALTVASGLKSRSHSVHFGGRKGAYPLEEAARRGLETFSVAGFPTCLSCVRQYLQKRKIELINAHTGSAQALAVAATRLFPNPPSIVRTRGDSRPARRNPGSGFIWSRTSGFIAAAEYIFKQFRDAFPALPIQASVVLPGIEDPCPGGPVAEPATGEPLRVGIVARLDPVKGHVYFLKAAAKILQEVPETVFVLVGREENVRAAYLRSIASGLGIIKSVEFLGHVPDPAAIMRLCHIGLIASIGSEAISRAALEWMAAGRPIVATAVGCLPEIIAERQTGFLVSPMNPGSMAQRLIELLKDKELRRRMGREARRRFESRFTLPRLIDETEKFYEETLHAVPSR